MLVPDTPGLVSGIFGKDIVEKQVLLFCFLHVVASKQASMQGTGSDLVIYLFPSCRGFWEMWHFVQESTISPYRLVLLVTLLSVTPPASFLLSLLV